MIRQKLIFISLLTCNLCWKCQGWTVRRCPGLDPRSVSQRPILPRFDRGRTWRTSSINDDPNQEELQPQLESDANESFWQSQREVAVALSNQAKSSLREEQRVKFEKRRWALVLDTAYIAWFLFCGCWLWFENPMTAVSFAFGATMGIAYTYGLGKSVEVLGQSVEDVGATQGAGVGEARFAFLILLFLFVGKFRGGEFGLQEIPSIAGFFTYQIASLNQGLREIND
jgi:hypothetical protein